MKYLRFISVGVLIACQLGCADNSSPTTPTTPTSTSAAGSSVLTPSTLSLTVGDSTQIRVVVAAGNNTFHLVTTSGTWASANETVATVTSAGVVTARAPGTADITVKVSEGTATVTVTVSTESQPTTFIGAIAGPNMETATLRFSATSPAFLSGAVYFQRTVLSLIGRFDEPTHVVDLVAGDFRFLGVVAGNVVTGAYVDPLGFTGGFSAIDATHTAVTPYCGSYTSDGTTPLGNADSGALVLAVSSDGTTVASALAADSSGAPQAFTGRSEGNALSLVSNRTQTLQGRLDGENATGVFSTANGSAASFSVSSSACH